MEAGLQESMFTTLGTIFETSRIKSRTYRIRITGLKDAESLLPRN